MVHLFQAIAYCIPYYGRSYFDFLLFSLIFYFTLYYTLYAISFLFSYNIFLLFCRPLDTAILHSIPFSHSIQFSIPYPVQVHIPFPFCSNFHYSQCQCHHILHSISNPFSTLYYLTLQTPFYSIFVLFQSICSSIPLNIPFHSTKIAVTATFRRTTFLNSSQRITNVYGPYSECPFLGIYPQQVHIRGYEQFFF